MELEFVTASDVRRYAENSLPEKDRKLIEQTLLDDERARQLVIKKADHEDVPPPSEATAQKLVSSLEACQQCLVGYEVMRSSDGPGPLVEFTAARFVKRWSLIKEVREALTENILASETARDFRGNADERFDIPLIALEQVILKDSDLVQHLREAFDVASAPIWKARIADWIAAIEDDIFRLVRLKRIYGGRVG